jgi:hypothetical protein
VGREYKKARDKIAESIIGKPDDGWGGRGAWEGRGGEGMDGVAGLCTRYIMYNNGRVNKVQWCGGRQG